MTSTQQTIDIDTPPEPIVTREKDLNTLFALVLVLWPFSTLGILLIDDPATLPHHVLYWATLLYGPVFFSALWIANRLKRKGAYPMAMRAWLLLCGTNVAIWMASFVLLLATR